MKKKHLRQHNLVVVENIHKKRLHSQLLSLIILFMMIVVMTCKIKSSILQKSFHLIKKNPQKQVANLLKLKAGLFKVFIS